MIAIRIFWRAFGMPPFIAGSLALLPDELDADHLAAAPDHFAVSPGSGVARERQPGWITLDGGFAARPCVVQDMSATGAKITIEDTNALPGRLRLAFSRDARTGRNCEVVWRRGKSAGVKFVR